MKQIKLSKIRKLSAKELEIIKGGDGADNIGYLLRGTPRN